MLFQSRSMSTKKTHKKTNKTNRIVVKTIKKRSYMKPYNILIYHRYNMRFACANDWRLDRRAAGFQEPLIDALPSCSIQNLAMIAHVGTAEDTFLTRFLECGVGSLFGSHLSKWATSTKMCWNFISFPAHHKAFAITSDGSFAPRRTLM